MTISAGAAYRIEKWYRRSLINYEQKYLYLYIAFNIWYCERGNTTNDREALHYLRMDSEVPRLLYEGDHSGRYRAVMEKLIDACVHAPLGGTDHWDGYILEIYDWEGLIEYWYQVRCRVVHGEYVPVLHTQLAYESLRILVDSIRVKEEITRITTLDI